MTGSNRRHHPCKGRALPAELIVRIGLLTPQAVVSARTSPAELRRFYSQNLVKVITARCEGFHFPFSLQSPLCLWDGHGCGGGTRTHDSQLMRLVRCRFSTPQYIPWIDHGHTALRLMCLMTVLKSAPVQALASSKLPALFCSAGWHGGTRTHDIRINSPPFYQLDYTPMSNETHQFHFVKTYRRLPPQFDKTKLTFFFIILKVAVRVSMYVQGTSSSFTAKSM